jgi:hypothetical protein
MSAFTPETDILSEIGYFRFGPRQSGAHGGRFR